MKTAFKILFTALALGVLTTSPLLRAQDEKQPPAEGRRGGGRGRGGMSVEAIEKAVGTLTAEQKTKITDILAKQREEMQAARGNGGGDREAMRAKMKAVHDEIRALLTPEQQTKFDEMPQGRGRGGQGGARRGKKDN